jgi:hypothetical protein
MIRLVVALVVALALHPRADDAPSRERTIAVAHDHHAPPAIVDVSLDVAVAGDLLGTRPQPVDGDAAALHSFRGTTRIWLRTQRLLC